MAEGLVSHLERRVARHAFSAQLASDLECRVARHAFSAQPAVVCDACASHLCF